MPNPSNEPTLLTTFCPSFPLHGSPLPSARVKLLLAATLMAAGQLVASQIAQGQAAQATPPIASPPAFSMADLRPALANVQNAITAINLARWKVPSDVRIDAQKDVTSMQRDLSVTLPDLMTKADSAAGVDGLPALAPKFAVFRNIDALYDVLLRVNETASLGASAADANSLEAARASLEDGRGRLGAWLLQAIGAQDARIAQAAAAAAHPAVAPAPPTRIVVEDGPENTKPRKKKPVAPPAPQ